MSLERLFPEDDKTLEGEKTLEANKEETNDIPSTPALEGDEEKFVHIQSIAPLEEVKERKKLKILTTNKLLTRLSVLLA